MVNLKMSQSTPAEKLDCVMDCCGFLSIVFFTTSKSDRRSITVTHYWFQKLPKSKKLGGAWNKIYSTDPFQLMSWWPHWLGIRLQSTDGCCWEIKSHWRQHFSKFIFPYFFCQADLLSDFLSDILIVKNPIGPSRSKCFCFNFAQKKAES